MSYAVQAEAVGRLSTGKMDHAGTRPVKSKVEGDMYPTGFVFVRVKAHGMIRY